MTDIYDAMGMDPKAQMLALAAALRRKQAQQEDEARSIQGDVAQQQGNANQYRSLGLLTSIGSNPLLQGIQRAATAAGNDFQQDARTSAGLLRGAKAGMPSLGGLRLGASALKTPKSTDPASPESKRAQGLVTGILGDHFTPEEIATMTEADLEPVLKYGTPAAQREVQREGQLGVTQRSTADRGQRGYQFGQRIGLDRDKLADAKAARESAATAKKDEQATEQVKTYGLEVAKSGIPETQGKIDDIKTIFSKYPDDLPGVGMASGRIPTRFEGEDAKRLGMLIGQLGAQYQKKMTGAGASDAERARYDEVTGLLKTGNSKSVRLGVKMMEDDLTRSGAAIDASFKPEVVSTYKNRVSRVPAATALPKDAAGVPTLDAPAPGTVVRKQYSKKANRTRELDATGAVVREYEGPPNG